MKIFLYLYFILSAISCADISFVNQLDDFSTPKKFYGEFKADGIGAIVIEGNKNSLLIKGEGSEVLFAGDSFFALKPQFSEGVLVIPIFKKVNGGARYYAILLCKHDPAIGVVGSLRHLNLAGVDMIYKEQKFFITNFINNFQYPKIEVEVSRFGGGRPATSTWKAFVDVTSTTMVP